MLLVTVSGSAAAPSTGAHSRKTATHSAARWSQVGEATWYGHRFQGRRTASGERFDMHMYTCAHRTLPIGTLLRVTNLTTRRTVIVRVNDRGPVPENRIVDLSYAAARSLGINHRGRMRVRLEKVVPTELAELDWPSAVHPGPLAASR